MAGEDGASLFSSGGFFSAFSANSPAFVASLDQQGDRKEHTQHFDLSQTPESGKASLCAYWCTFHDIYSQEKNEKNLWGWLEPECACFHDATSKSDERDVPKETLLVVFVGDNDQKEDDKLREVALSHRHGKDSDRGFVYREIGYLSCSEVLSASTATAAAAVSPQQSHEASIIERILREQGTGKSRVVYMFSDCPSVKGSLSYATPDWTDQTVSDAREMLSIYTDFDLILAIISQLKKRVTALVDRSSNMGVGNLAPEIVWWVTSTTPLITEPSLTMEHQLLQQYLTQRHILFESGVLAIDQSKIHAASSAWSWLSRHQDLSSSKTQRYLGRLIQEKSRQMSAASAAAAPSWHPLESSLSLLQLCGPILNSRGYHDRCLPRPLTLLPVLVTGLGGSGTHAIASSLKSMNIDMPHEKIGKHGSVCWQYAVNDAIIGGEYPHHARLSDQLGVTGVRGGSVLTPRFSHVVQVLRPAAAQISSLTTHLPASYAFVHGAMQVMLLWRSMVLTQRRAFSGLASPGSGAVESDVYYAALTESVNAARQKQLAASSNMRGIAPSMCPRGSSCNLHFAATSWLLWNAHVTCCLRTLRGSEGFSGIYYLGREEGSQGEAHTNEGDEIARLLSLVCSLVSAEDSSVHGDTCAKDASAAASANVRSKDGNIPRSVHHSQHEEYTMEDVKREDPLLAEAIISLTSSYHPSFSS